MTTEHDWRASVLPFTLHYEGGLSLDRKDPGNWTGGKAGKGTLKGTKYGIAASAHPTLDIRNLTLAQAGDIYWAEYAVKPGFTSLGLPLLLVVFDAGVNCGPARAQAWLAAAAAKTTVQEQIAAFSALNLAYHRSLKTWGRYGKGWSARIAACQKQALLLIAAAPVAVHPNLPALAADLPPGPPKAATQPRASLLTLIIRAVTAVLLPGTPERSIRMTVDVTSVIVAAIYTLVPIILGFVANLLFKTAWPTIQKYLGEKNAAVFQDRVNQVLNAGIGFAVQKAAEAVRSTAASPSRPRT